MGVQVQADGDGDAWPDARAQRRQHGAFRVLFLGADHGAMHREIHTIQRQRGGNALDDAVARLMEKGILDMTAGTTLGGEDRDEVRPRIAQRMDRAGQCQVLALHGLQKRGPLEDADAREIGATFDAERQAVAFILEARDGNPHLRPPPGLGPPRRGARWMAGVVPRSRK